MSDSEIYTKLLLCKKLGYPLWDPQPASDLPLEYKEHGVRIGDVGYITPNGAFYFIFNICVPPNDPVNSQNGVPDNFEPLAEFDERRHVRRSDVMFSPGHTVSTKNVKKRTVIASIETDGAAPIDGAIDIHISCSSETGAALLLPQGASWFAFLEKEHWETEDLQLYLVTGWVKASAWGVTTISHHSGTGEISMKLGASLIAAGQLKYSWDEATENSGVSKAGPERQQGDERWGQNQSAFLSGYRIAKRRHMVSLAGPIRVTAIEGSSSEIKGSFPWNLTAPSLSRRTSDKTRISKTSGSGGPSELFRDHSRIWTCVRVVSSIQSHQRLLIHRGY
ncbi:hypothetical protein B0H10DRAFT_1950941 [Mycena sp. CBHHK59/15]|nr:hypothetical protein B0H10DRAFT_1950941 [Mycena sp. CBHHK59/15]